MLGIKAVNLDDADEFQLLLDKTRMYIKATAAYPLKPHEVWLGYQTVYKPCLQYPLSTTLLNKK
eukprot:7925483-Ditylum_brightwellii.AAC.2